MDPVPTTLLRRVTLPNGDLVDVRCADGRVESITAPGSAPPADEIIDGEEGYVLPGLTDHHVHLLAWAAAITSVDVSGGPENLARTLAAAQPDPSGWIRGVGYHDSSALLDRDALDRMRADVPVRVQHRGGALWVLNSAAIRQLDLENVGAHPGLERDEQGRLTGRIWRADEWLSHRWPSVVPDLSAVGATLARWGVTSVTDATPGCRGTDLIGQAHRAGVLPQRITMMAEGPIDDGLAVGPLKLLLDERDLPSLDDLVDQIRRARRAGRPVAVHCVGRVELLLLLAAFDQVAPVRGDRIEHGAVIPDEELERIHALGLTIVTQPGFITDRGDDLVADTDPDEVRHLYRYRSLLRARIPVALSSDAPYGPANPWTIVRAARDRCTPSGRLLGADEHVTARQALDSFIAPTPGGQPVAIRPGALADLVVLRPGAVVGDCDDPVAFTLIGGRVIYRCR